MLPSHRVGGPHPASLTWTSPRALQAPAPWMFRSRSVSQRSARRTSTHRPSTAKLSGSSVIRWRVAGGRAGAESSMAVQDVASRGIEVADLTAGSLLCLRCIAARCYLTQQPMSMARRC